jgi:2,3-bisphosphoglycerate-independent phosphoglycerate mutase
MGRFIFIFVDGVGLGKADHTNPFYVGSFDFLAFYDHQSGQPGKVVVKAIDPLLGIDGTPTSASGQTSLFTGVNVPGILKRHKGSYPDKFMRRLLKQGNLLLWLRQNRFKSHFLNAYPRHGDLFSSRHLRLHDDGEIEFSPAFPRQYRRRISTTSCMLLSMGERPFDEADIMAGRSLFHDYSNRDLIERGLQVPLFSPEQAAEVIANTAGDYDLLLYEYFLTDMYGHGSPLRECVDLIGKLNRLLKHLVSLLDETGDTLLLTSDHGNLEDVSSRIHTRNPVPLITWGRNSGALRNQIGTIADVTPAVLRHFGLQDLPENRQGIVDVAEGHGDLDTGDVGF